MLKIFVDADIKSTKVCLNVVNQLKGNSGIAHPIVAYAETPEHHHNLKEMFKVCFKI
jgi:hypothetical protein